MRSVRFILKETGSVGELEDNKPRVSPRIRFASGADYLVWEERIRSLALHLPYRAARTTHPPEKVLSVTL